MSYRNLLDGAIAAKGAAEAAGAVGLRPGDIKSKATTVEDLTLTFYHSAQWRCVCREGGQAPLRRLAPL
jgi:hypothetical protein